MSDYLYAAIKAVDDDAGTWTAVASTDNLDRDNEVVAYRAFEPLPKSIPVHIDHDMSVAGLVGRAVPRYSGGRLLVEGRFASAPRAQVIRRMVKEGALDSLSVGFMSPVRRQVDGVRTVVKAELLEVSFVTVPSNRQSVVLTARRYGYSDGLDAVLARVAALLAEAGGPCDTRSLLAQAEYDLLCVELHDMKRAEYEAALDALDDVAALCARLSAGTATFSGRRPTPEGGQWPPPYYLGV